MDRQPGRQIDRNTGRQAGLQKSGALHAETQTDAGESVQVQESGATHAGLCCESLCDDNYAL